MNENEPSGAEQTNLADLVSKALERFKQKTLFINQYDRWEAMNWHKAAEEIIQETSVDPYDLLRSLSRETHFTPKDLDLIPVGSFDYLMKEIAIAIVAEELSSRHPEVEEETKKRFELINLML